MGGTFAGVRLMTIIGIANGQDNPSAECAEWVSSKIVTGERIKGMRRTCALDTASGSAPAHDGAS